METIEKSSKEPLKLVYISSNEDLKSHSKLLDECFPIQKDRFLEDFPVWDCNLNPKAKILTVQDSNKNIVGSVAYKKSALKMNGKSINVAIIGGVATHLDYRSRGIASAMINRVVNDVKKEDVDLVLLWGSEHALYQKYGFEVCGSQVRVPLKEINHLVDHTSISISKGWNDQLLTLMTQRSSGLLREASDLNWIKAHKNVKWLWTGSPLKPTSFVAFNRGIDLQNMVHEWGGNPEEIKAILSYLKGVNPNIEILATPAEIKKLNLEIEPRNLEFLALAKVLNPKSIMQKIYDSQWTGSITSEGEEWTVKLNESESVQLTDNALSVLFFGPEKFDGQWEKFFPLPLWIWGLDAG